MSNYKLLFDEGWYASFQKLDVGIQRKIMKKVIQLANEHSSRHLKHGLRFFVEEVGQFRICFKVDEQKKSKLFCFVGDHKDYARWYSGVT